MQLDSARIEFIDWQGMLSKVDSTLRAIANDPTDPQIREFRFNIVCRGLLLQKALQDVNERPGVKERRKRLEKIHYQFTELKNLLNYEVHLYDGGEAASLSYIEVKDFLRGSSDFAHHISAEMRSAFQKGKAGRPPDEVVHRVTEYSAEAYEKLTGNNASRSKDRITGEPVGFVRFLEQIFNILEIKAKAERAVRAYKT